VAEILSGEGYAVELTGSGEAGLAAARASPPDVVLLDLMLPGMDGAAVLQELRQEPRLSAIRVVVTTGVRTSHLRKLLRPDALLFKPFGVDELVLAVAGVAAPRV
jgi:two-component system phosphate regulon response regulator PhoB